MRAHNKAVPCRVVTLKLAAPHRGASPPPPGASTPRPSAAARARCVSQCAHANRSPEACTPSAPAARRRADPRTAALSRRHTQVRARTFHEPRGLLEVDAERACQGRAIQKQGWHPPRKACPGRHESHICRPGHPSDRRKRPETQRCSARAAGAGAHTPTARRKCACPAPRRPTPRRPRNSRAAPQARPDARRAFHEPRGPPETDAEVARAALWTVQRSSHQ